MVDEIEHRTIRLLQELRAEIHEMRDDLTNCIDGNTITLNMLAGLAHNHEARIATLEARS